MSIARKIWLLVVLTILITIVFWISIRLYQINHTPLVKPGQQATSVQLPFGQGANYLMKTLYEKKLLPHSVLWKLLISVHMLTHQLKVGEYEIKPGMTLVDLVDHITSGQVMIRQFTIVEGWTYADLIAALQKNTYLKHIIQTLNEQQILQILGAQQTHAEGLFYPDTYFYSWGNTDFSILQEAYNKMQMELMQAWQQRAVESIYQHPYQVLIAASLIEKETALVAEKPLISAVIVNRLRKKMRLQIDASVLYGLKNKSGQRILREDLQADTPYNTYRRVGLPPTPIALPSRVSLRAATHPARVDYLFYVLTSAGHHVFSNNYSAHLHAVKRYREARRERLLDFTQPQSPIPIVSE